VIFSKYGPAHNKECDPMSQKGWTPKLYFFFNLGAWWGWVVNATPRLLYPRGKEPVFIIQEVGRAPWPLWMRVKNKKSLTQPGVLPPNLPPGSASLYRLGLLHSGPLFYAIMSILIFMFVPTRWRFARARASGGGVCVCVCVCVCLDIPYSLLRMSICDTRVQSLLWKSSGVLIDIPAPLKCCPIWHNNRRHPLSVQADTATAGNLYSISCFCFVTTKDNYVLRVPSRVYYLYIRCIKCNRRKLHTEELRDF
jgi:hypothetical protein